MNDIYITAKLSIDYIKVKTGMPSDVDEGAITAMRLGRDLNVSVEE